MSASLLVSEGIMSNSRFTYLTTPTTSCLVTKYCLEKGRCETSIHCPNRISINKTNTKKDFDYLAFPPEYFGKFNFSSLYL